MWKKGKEETQRGHPSSSEEGDDASPDASKREEGTNIKPSEHKVISKTVEGKKEEGRKSASKEPIQRRLQDKNPIDEEKGKPLLPEVEEATSKALDVRAQGGNSCRTDDEFL